MKKDITELFSFLDDFTKAVDKYNSQYLIESEKPKKLPTRTMTMSISEIITIVLLFHQSPSKNFKFFYNSYLQLYKQEFPTLVSYERFVAIMQRTIQYFVALVNWLSTISKKTGVSFIDSTSLGVCSTKRISRNKVFKGSANIGKTTKGWFYGFKLHLVINDIGEIQSVRITQGNVDDRAPVIDMTKKLKGLLFGDKGYIKSELFDSLYAKGLKLITNIKSNMKNKFMSAFEKETLKKRSIVETVFDYLKNKFELEHTRHRSFWNFCVHILSTITTYSLKTSKPKVKYKMALEQI